MQLKILAKSDKHTGYCVAGVNGNGKWVRLVRNEEGNALSEEDCPFKKGDIINAVVTKAPLKHQSENWVLSEIENVKSAPYDERELFRLAEKPRIICGNEEPWLTQREMKGVTRSLVMVSVSNFQIYKNDEEKYKARFTYNGKEYNKFSVTDPEYKKREKKIGDAVIVISLPDKPYAKYGHDLYYKFIAAIYPIHDAFLAELAK